MVASSICVNGLDPYFPFSYRAPHGVDRDINGLGTYRKWQHDVLMLKSLETYSKGGQRLLVTAEKLFGQHGLDGVSLRQISVAARHANSSAVHHHFGSKAGLIQAVYEMRLPMIEAARKAHLDRLLIQPQISFEDLIGALLLPIILMPELERETYSRFMLALMPLPLAEQPFFITQFNSPASAEINRRIMNFWPDMPADVIERRFRLAANTFLIAVAYPEPPKVRQHPPYDAGSIYWQDILQAVVAIFLMPYPPRQIALNP